MTSGVYAIINTVTGMAYVGSSRNIEARWKVWQSVLRRPQSKHSNKMLYEDWVASGESVFELRTLEETTAEFDALVEAEQRWISAFEGRRYNVHAKPRRAKVVKSGKRRDRPSLYPDIGENIRMARVKQRLSQQALGQRLGVSHAAISDIERAKTRPDIDTLAVIADALGVPLSQLVILEER